MFEFAIVLGMGRVRVCVSGWMDGWKERERDRKETTHQSTGIYRTFEMCVCERERCEKKAMIVLIAFVTSNRNCVLIHTEATYQIYKETDKGGVIV